MYKYSEEQESRIRADREELKRLRSNKRIVKAAARGGVLSIPGEVLKRAREEAQRCDSYIAGLDGVERIIFEKHYGGGVSLAIVGELIGRSGNSCADIIRRQLATRSLDGSSGEAAAAKRHKPRPKSRRRKGGEE